MNRNSATASSASFLSCQSCQLLSKWKLPPKGGRTVCPRCGETLNFRRPGSIARTWALIIAAFVFYIPANVLPVMVTMSFGKTKTDTIISGVIYFMATGMWPIALIIFIASVFVPIMKLLALSFLLISVQWKVKWRPQDRARLYRITEVVGRWSMVDIYVVTIVVALVKLGTFATVEAGSGAIFFAAVVVITMFAAMTFDPRLIWDTLGAENE